MSETTKMIVNAVVNPKEKESFTFYSEKSAPLFKKAGAVPVAKYKISQTVIGTKTLHVVAIMEFPNEQAITEVFESEEYKKLLPFRDKAFVELNVFVGN